MPPVIRRVCVVGSGGREHALAVALARTADVTVTPGNPGMAQLSSDVRSGGHAIRCDGATRPDDVEADLWVIGPEAPLVDGLADRLRAQGKLVFGPGADGARLEGSKAWMKEVLRDAGVPTAAHEVFSSAGPAIEYLRSQPGPWVVKTDGLAAGKGVLVTSSRDAADADVVAKLSGEAFGDAGRRVVIEEYLEGTELSIMAICDGTTAVALAPAQDFKRVGDGDHGPNTGGMGAYSPVRQASAGIVEEVMDVAVRPTLAALQGRGVDYRGVLYAGVMLTPDGPRVLEFNVRFGDPETQVVLPRWRGDVTAVLALAAAGRLGEVPAPSFVADAAVCVVLAAEGYPVHPRYGAHIEGLEKAADLPGVQIYSAGTSNADPEASAPSAGPLSDDGLVTAGGRVLGVTALGPTLAAARAGAYEAADLVTWTGQVRRDDIALAASTTAGADNANQANPQEVTP